MAQARVPLSGYPTDSESRTLARHQLMGARRWLTRLVASRTQRSNECSATSSEVISSAITYSSHTPVTTPN